jgi:hypothetical protein
MVGLKLLQRHGSKAVNNTQSSLQSIDWSKGKEINTNRFVRVSVG